MLEELRHKAAGSGTGTLQVTIEQLNAIHYAQQAQIEALQGQLQTARYDAVRAFVRGEDKLCLACGAKEPCALKDDPCSPCTFEPTPMDLLTANQRLRERVEALQRERDEARRKYHEAMDIMSAWRNIDHAEAVARLLVSNKELVSLRQDYLVQQTQYVEATDRLAKELSQLQALVRAFFVARAANDQAAYTKAFIDLKRTLDATTPAHEQAKATVFNEWDGALRKMADVEPEGGDGE